MTIATRRQPRILRMAPLSGAAFAIVTVVAFVVFGGGAAAPTAGDTGATIASYYVANHSNSQIAAYLFPVVATLLTLFVAAAKPLIGVGRGVSASLFTGGGFIAAASFLFAGAVHLAIVNAAGDHVDATALRALAEIDVSTILAFTAGMGILFFGAAGCMISSSGGLRVLGWIALPLAIINITPGGAALFPLNALWIIVVSVMLVVRGDRSVTRAASPPTE